MPFHNRSRGLRLRPVNRIKHVFDEQGAMVAGTAIYTDVIKSVQDPALASTEEVQNGSTVNGIYLDIEVVGTSSAALTNVYLIVYKNPGGNLAAIAPNTVGSNDNKRFVIHQEMVMLQEQTGSNPRTLFKGVIIIPRGYKRMAMNDTLLIGMLAPGISVNYCIQCHYKEFR